MELRQVESEKVIKLKRHHDIACLRMFNKLTRFLKNQQKEIEQTIGWGNREPIKGNVKYNISVMHFTDKQIQHILNL